MIKDDKTIRESIKEAYSKMKPFSFKHIVDFKEEQLKKMNDEQVIDHIMSKIRPDTSKMDRAEIECLDNLPDWFVDKGFIDHFEIEYIEKSEATFEPRMIISVYVNDDYFQYMATNNH